MGEVASPLRMSTGTRVAGAVGTAGLDTGLRRRHADIATGTTTDTASARRTTAAEAVADIAVRRREETTTTTIYLCPDELQGTYPRCRSSC